MPSALHGVSVLHVAYTSLKRVPTASPDRNRRSSDMQEAEAQAINKSVYKRARVKARLGRLRVKA